MDIILQHNKSEKNKAVKNITNLQTISGTLKSATSIIDPVILIEIDISTIANCNYLTISDFGRKYFVNNITSVKNGLVEISAHVDVLSSWYSQLKTCECITKRQQIDYNLYLNDGTFRTYQNPQVLTKAFPSGFTTQSFVLAVAGS